MLGYYITPEYLYLLPSNMHYFMFFQTIIIGCIKWLSILII